MSAKINFDMFNNEVKALTVQQLDELKRIIANTEKTKKNEAKEEDLKTVKKLCRLHGFTVSNLKGFLKTRKKSDEVKVKITKAKESV